MTRRAEHPIARFDNAGLRRDVLTHMAKYGLSRNEIARSIGMSAGSVHRWFRAEGGVSADFAASLALICMLSLDDYIIDLEATTSGRRRGG